MFLTNIPGYSELPDIGSFKFEGKTVGEVISTLLPYVFFGAGLFLFIYLLLGGFKLLTSAGDPKAVAAGQKMLTNAIVGFLIIIASYWVTQILQQVFQINILGQP